MTWSLFVYTLAICIYSGHIYDTDIVLNFDELSKPFVYKVLMFCYRSFFMLIILQAFSSYSLVKLCQFSDKHILSIFGSFRLWNCMTIGIVAAPSLRADKVALVFASD